MPTDWTTPFEHGNGNQTTTWQECVAFHERLARAFPGVLSFSAVGRSDGGLPIHLGIVSADGVFDPASVKRAGRTVVFNNNGIHPGEPEGIDVCMALVRDLCTRPEQLRALGGTVLVYIPVYNVDGALNRQDTSRVNQVGPERFGFRGNARHLDLNRDFVKQMSANARCFAEVFAAWDPDLLVDTHTSNGADYAHVVTLIPTQPDKLGGSLGALLRERLLPALYGDMQRRGWPMCPYVNPVKEIPDDGIADFLDLPRFSTGYAALHHTIGFMPETHMLKTFGERYHGMRALVEAVLAWGASEGDELRRRRAADRAAVSAARRLPLAWALDTSRPSTFRFQGFRAVHEPSRLGDYRRLRYDRDAPYEADIPYYDRYAPIADAAPPLAYLVPQAWREAAERLRRGGATLEPVTQEQAVAVECYRIVDFETRARPFEGHHLHERIVLQAEPATVTARPGDWLVRWGQPRDRYVFETLEPLGADSYFRWGFFDAVLDRKETFSDYVFEDEAERLLAAEPALREAFDRWKRGHSELVADRDAVLSFLFLNCERYAEPEFRRYPVFRIVDAGVLAGVKA